LGRLGDDDVARKHEDIAVCHAFTQRSLGTMTDAAPLTNAVAERKVLDLQDIRRLKRGSEQAAFNLLRLADEIGAAPYARSAPGMREFFNLT
jgi:hypothetical protein